MHARLHPITLAASPVAYSLTSLHFGHPGSGPKVYIQAALHADEIPGMLVARQLRAQLTALEQAGRIRGEIVLVPAANPLGLGQAIHGTAFGRFDLATGVNFNRAFRHVAGELKESLTGQLGADAAANVALVRRHAREAVARWEVRNDAEVLKQTLLGLAIDADIVLDLHCDNEAVLHLYAGTPLAQRFAPLADLLGAEVLLVALEAGEEPFDEACSRLWWDLAAHFGPDVALPPACAAATVELRGELDVSYDQADADAGALLRFLAAEGVLDLPDAAPAPPARCVATPLEAVEPILAPHAGIVVFLRALGEMVAAGETVADLIDPVSGVATPLVARHGGRFFARTAHRHLLRGMNVGKLAGTVTHRSGNLLSL